MRPLRAPILEWARREAAGELGGLGWVDAAMPAGAEPFSMVEREGQARFRHVPYAAFLPDLLAEAAQAEAEAGETGLLQALQLIFARCEWRVATRALWWTSLSPAPGLLTALVEAAGVGPETHGDDAEALARITALLPTWLPRRGRLDAALELRSSPARLAHVSTDGPAPRTPELRAEVLACRDAGWWAARRSTEASPELRLTHGFLQFQPQAAPPWPLLPEDVLVEWRPDDAADPGLLRLLPPWSTPRLALAAPTETP